MYKKDFGKEKLFYGLMNHFPMIPKWIIYRTVELASSPGKAFDALYDYKEKDLPVSWDFSEQKWKKNRVVMN